MSEMSRDELLKLKKVAESRMLSHRRNRRWLLIQFRAAKRYAREILDGNFKQGWPKLDDLMKRMTSLGPHYIDNMKNDLRIFVVFPDFCSELEGHISRIEPVYQKMVDKWLDIQSSLVKNEEPPESKRIGSDGTVD